MKSIRSGGARPQHLAGIASVALFALLAGPARAADPKPAAGPDTVTLQDGTVVTGTFTELVPQNRITVLVGNESKTFQWNLVRKATHDGRVVAENAPAAPAVLVVQPQPQQQVVIVQSAPPGAAAPSAAAAFVHLEGDDDAVLEMRGPQGGDFVAMCQSPCDRALPLDAMYRIGGSGVRKSTNFKLASTDGKPVVVDVDSAHTGGFVGGIVMTALGPVVAVAGLFVYAVSSITFYTSSGSVAGGSSAGKTTGGIMMLSGVALTAVGIPLIVMNSRTKVKQEVGAPTPPRSAGLLNVRLPEYRDVAHEVPMPGASYAPVFGLAF